MFGKRRTSTPAAPHAAAAAAGGAAAGPTSPQQPSTPHMQHFLRSQQRQAAEAAAAYDAATDDDDLLDDYDDGVDGGAGRAFAQPRGAAGGGARLAASSAAGGAAAAAGSGSRRRQQPRAAAYSLNKHASDAGLAGVAEAAGAAMLAELPAIADWRQALLQTRVVAGAVAVATIGYALLLAPRLLGWRAEWRLVSRLGYDNALTFVLMNLLWIYPQLLAGVMWPSFRSSGGSKVQLWRYLAASNLAGSFALLVYLARWSPRRRGHKLPPARLAGRALWLQRLYEGRLWPALLLATALLLLALPFAASAATWAQFGLLARQSQAVHVMCLDLALLTLLAPWLVVRDAAARGWAPASTVRGRAALAAAMLLLPVVGPAAYLLLRPICQQGPGVLGMLASKAADQLGMGQQGRQRGRGGHQGGRQRLAGRRSAAAPGGPAAAAGSVQAAVAEAAAVPLPTPMQAALGSFGALLNDGWNWAGQHMAAARGGGAPVAAADEVAGDEMDVDGGDGGVSATTDSHNPFDDLAHAWARQAGGAGAGSHTLAAGAGLEPPPLQLLLPGGGCELQFDGGYDEEDFELDSAGETDELEGSSDFSWDQDSSDDEDGDEGDDEGEAEQEEEEATEEIVTDEGQERGEDELQQSAGGDRGVVAAAVAVDEGGVGVGVARFGGPAGAGQLAVSSDTVPLGGGNGSQGHSGGSSARAAKTAAMRLLADLSQQEHPRLAAAAAHHS